jgi:hypothetical protein
VYGGLKSDQVKRLKDLETENARLRKAISDLASQRQSDCWPERLGRFGVPTRLMEDRR